MKATVTVHLIRLSLRCLGFSRTVEIIGRIAPRPGPGAAEHESRSSNQDPLLHPMTWAVRAAGRRTVPRNPCLPTALALLVFLRRSEIPADLRIGVERPDGPALTAHAWVEVHGSVILGGSMSPRRYRAFPVVPVGTSSPAVGEGS